MRPKGILWTAFMVYLCSLSVGQVNSDQTGTGAEIAVKRFLQHAVSRGEKDSHYWEEAWLLDFKVVPAQLSVGLPFERRKLDPDGVRRFAEGADLLASTKLTARSYPVYHGGQFIGSVNVSERDSGWAYVGRSSYTSVVDSLAIVLVADGYKVSDITSKPFGVLLVMEKDGEPLQLISLAQWTIAELGVESSGSAGQRSEPLDYERSLATLRLIAARHVGSVGPRSDSTDK